MKKWGEKEKGFGKGNQVKEEEIRNQKKSTFTFLYHTSTGKSKKINSRHIVYILYIDIEILHCISSRHIYLILYSLHAY